MNSPMATLATLGYGDTSGVAMGPLIRGFKKKFKIFFQFFTVVDIAPRRHSPAPTLPVSRADTSGLTPTVAV